jgi:DNA-binding NarL/FixJ family response regulator
VNAAKKDAGDKTQIVIVDDHPVLRRGVVQLVNQEPDLIVCGEADDAPDALKLLDKLKPELVLVDVTLKNSSGIELIKDIRIRHPNMLVLVLSMHSESFYAERVLRAGARGYVAKGEPPGKVIEGIRRVLTGEIYVSEKVAAKMLGKLAGVRGSSEGPTVDSLSDREFEVFRLIGNGVATRDIADRLHLSVKTIETHRENIKQKLRLKNAAELLQHAIQWVQYESQG